MPGLDLERVHHGACSGLHAAGQRAEQLEWHVGGNLDDIALVTQRMRRERRLAEEVAVDAVRAVSERGRAVGSFGEEIVGEEPIAVRLVAVVAARARTAGIEGHDDVITRHDLRDALAHGLHDAGALVSQHHGLRGRQHAVTDDEVGVADARRDDANEDLARSRIIELERLERQRGVRCAGDGCANLHATSSRGLSSGHSGCARQRSG